MSWIDRLRRASFRGLDLLTDSLSYDGGRRLVIDEFPGSEIPEVTDLGAKSWGYKINFYFIGKDYDLACDAFLAKLQIPGADWLVHPRWGSQWVRAHHWSVSESNDKGGYCTVNVEFVPGGSQPSAVGADMVDQAAADIEEFDDAVEDDFDLVPMSADGMTAFVAAVHQQLENVRKIISLTSLPLTWASQVMNLVNGIKGDLAVLMHLPQDYSNALRSLTNALGGASGDDLDGQARPRVVVRLASIATASSTPVLTGVAATDSAVRSNLAKESALRSRLLVSAAVQVALADYQTENDRDAAQASAVGAIDGLLPSLPDSVFDAAVAMRTSLISALQAQDLQPETTRDVVKSMPAAVLAYRMKVDEDTFIKRNNVRHPLFVIGRVYG